MVLEFYPNPYDCADDVLASLSDIADIKEVLYKQWPGTRQIPTGVRGIDVYYEVACTDVGLVKTVIERLLSVKSAQEVSLTREILGKSYTVDLQVCLRFLAGEVM